MNWFEIENSDEILTPALLFYPDRINTNIDQMIRITGSPDRLRPHVKSYKCSEIVQMQLDAGISKFKCATLTEAEMLAELSVTDVLVSYPLIGPAQQKFIDLVGQYPKTQFSTLIDHPSQVDQWKKGSKNPIDIFIDLNVGMNRTGILPKNALSLFEILHSDHFHFRGFHAYDGHIHPIDLLERESAVELSFAPVTSLLNSFQNKNIETVCGGSISFPVHARHVERTLSPGTTLLWDYGYTRFTDMKFDLAAALMTRVVSKPGDHYICLDLGHKAVASEMKEPPVHFPQIPDAKIITHSEEHLVLEIENPTDWPIGKVLYGFPRHICPTVALHENAGIVKDRCLSDFWHIKARKRNYTL